jgi:AcrR family transcriptional regulator
MSPRAKTDGRRKPRPGLAAQRRHLLDTAVGLFGERGSRDVSVSDLCHAANISRPTFYRCFPDKDALVATLYREAVLGPIESIVLSSLGARLNEPGWLRRANDDMLDALFAEAHVAALLFVESSDPRSPAHTIIQQAFDDVSATLRDLTLRSGGQPLGPVALKATLVAFQWVVHDAIQKGLTPGARADAKDATWELTQRLFLAPAR